MKDKVLTLDDTLSKHLEIAVRDIDPSDQEAFVQARRKGIGASDIAACLSLVPQWKTAGDLIEEKTQTQMSEKERSVGTLATVRMGSDLEEIILSKAAAALNVTLVKPKDMYRFKDYPWLTVNYDGVISEGPELGVPVEAKCVSLYGRKYFDFAKAGDDRHLNVSATNPEQYFRIAADCLGIPPQYYAQVQQELLGTAAEYAYLAAMDVKEWTLYTFKIPADRYAQGCLVIASQQIWAQIEKRLAHV